MRWLSEKPDRRMRLGFSDFADVGCASGVVGSLAPDALRGYRGLAMLAPRPMPRRKNEPPVYAPIRVHCRSIVTTSFFSSGAKEFQRRIEHQLHLHDYIAL